MLSAEVSKSSKVSNTPPVICVDTYLSHNPSNFVSRTTKTEPVMLYAHDKEILEILGELENNVQVNCMFFSCHVCVRVTLKSGNYRVWIHSETRT